MIKNLWAQRLHKKALGVTAQGESSVFLEVFDDGNDLSADALLSLAGGSTDVRQSGNGGMLAQLHILGGLLSPNVQTGGTDLAAVQGL